MKRISKRYYAEKRRGVNDLARPPSEMGRGFATRSSLGRAEWQHERPRRADGRRLLTVGGWTVVPGVRRDTFNSRLGDDQTYQGGHGENDSDQIKSVQSKSHVILLYQRVPC